MKHSRANLCETKTHFFSFKSLNDLLEYSQPYVYSLNISRIRESLSCLHPSNYSSCYVLTHSLVIEFVSDFLCTKYFLIRK